MSRYGINFYGPGTYYGEIPLIEFDARPITAQSETYGQLTVRWHSPSGDWDLLRLTRDSYGFAPRADMGTTVLELPQTNAVTEFSETGLQEGKFYYYTVWVRATIDNQWRRAGDVIGLVTKDWGYRGYLFEMIPGIYREKDIDTSQYRLYGRGQLERFMEIFGYETDHIRTEYETLKWLNDPQRCSGGLLPLMADQLGFGFESELGMRLARQQMKNAIYIYKHKGTQLGVEAVTSVLTGWAPVVTQGYNTALDQNATGAKESIGSWTNVSNATVGRRSTSDASAPGAISGPVPPPVGASTGDEGSGTWMLLLTALGAGDMVVQSFPAGTATDNRLLSIPVTGGLDYTISIYSRALDTVRSVQVGVEWFDATGTSLGAVTQNGAVANATATWTRHIYSLVAPATARFMRVQLRALGAALNDRIVFAALQVEQSATVRAYQSARSIRIKFLAERVNLVKNASFEVNAADWEGATRSTAQAKFGAASGLVQDKAVTTFPATVSNPYALSTYVYGPGGSYRLSSLDQSVQLPGIGNYISTPDSPETSLQGVTQVLRIPNSGSTVAYADTPAHASFQVNADLEIRWEGTVDEFMAYGASGTSPQEYLINNYTHQVSGFKLYFTTGGSTNLQFQYSLAGSNTGINVPIGGLLPGQRIRIRLFRVHSTGLTTIYGGLPTTAWESLSVLGSSTVGAGAVIPAGTSIMQVGGGNSFRFAGNVASASVSIGGVEVLSPDFTDSDTWTVGETNGVAKTDSAGKTWTLRNGAMIVKETERRSLRLTGASGVYASTPDSDALSLRGTASTINFSGHAGTYVSTPDAAALDITGDIDIRFKWRPRLQSPVRSGVIFAKRGAAGNRGWYGYHDRASGKVGFAYSVDGTVENFVLSNTARSNQPWYKITRVAATGVIKHWESADGTNWTDLGAAGTQITGNLFANTSDLKLGEGTSEPFDGQIDRFELRNGIDGAVVTNPNFEATPWVIGDVAGAARSSGGLTWTLAGNAEIAAQAERRFLRLGGGDDYASTPDTARNSVGANRLTANQSGIETDATGWGTPTNVTLAQSTAQFLDGAASLEMTSVAAGTMAAKTQPVTTMAVTVGWSYSAFAWFRSATVARTALVSINWRDAGGALLSSTAGSGVVTTTTGWTLAVVTGVAPAGAVFSSVELQVSGTAAAGEVHYADRIAFFDGDGLDLRWWGTLDDWTPGTAQVLISKVNTNQQAYQIHVDPGGKLVFNISGDGTTYNRVNNGMSTNPLGFPDSGQKWLRATFACLTGVWAMYSSDDGVTWASIGGGTGTAGTIFDSTAALIVGGNFGGTANNLFGSVYAAEVRNSPTIIGGDLIADAHFYARPWDNGETNGATGADTYGGATWTLTGTGAVIKRAYASDLDIQIRVAADDWTPAAVAVLLSKWADSGAQHSFLFRLEATGTPMIFWSRDGITFPFINASAALPSTFINNNGRDGWLRVTVDADNGANQSVFTFYQSLDNRATWTLVGTAQTINTAMAFYDSTEPLIIGGTNGGTVQNLPGNAFEMKMMNGIGSVGVPVAHVDFTSEPWAVGDTTAATGVDAHGNTWTLNGSGAIIQRAWAEDLDVRIRAAGDDWTSGAYQVLFAKYVTTPTQDRGYMLRVTPSGYLEAYLSANGALALGTATSVLPVLPDGSPAWLRYTWRQSDGRLQFLQSNDGATWAQVGADRTILIWGINDSTASLMIGQRGAGEEPFIGNIYNGSVRRGIDGVEVADFDANGVDATGPRTPTTMVGETGETWTITGPDWTWVGVGSGDIVDQVVPANTWTRIFLPVMAGVATMRMEIDGPGPFHIDGVLGEAGTTLNDFFDGTSQSNEGEYMWGLTPGNSPSYYYSRRTIKNFRLNQRLSEFLPAGASWALLYAEQP